MAKRTRSKAKKPRKTRAKPRAPRPIAPRDERVDLLQAIDEMVDVTPGGRVSTRQAPQGKGRTPWMLISSFYLPSDTTYDDTLTFLRTWRDDRTIERLIRAQRLSRIQARYVTERGKEGEYTLAEIGPWELAVSRAVERVGVRDGKDDSLVDRYGAESGNQSEISSVVVWFSSSTVETLDDAPPMSFGIGTQVIRGEADVDVVEEEVTDEFVELPTEEPETAPPPPKPKKRSLWDRIKPRKTSLQINLERARAADKAERAARKAAGKKARKSSGKTSNQIALERARAADKADRAAKKKRNKK